MVQKRNPEFQGICHCHLICFYEQIIGKPRFCVDVEHSAQQVPFCAVLKILRHDTERTLLAYREGELLGVKGSALTIEPLIGTRCSAVVEGLEWSRRQRRILPDPFGLGELTEAGKSC